MLLIPNAWWETLFWHINADPFSSSEPVLWWHSYFCLPFTLWSSKTTSFSAVKAFPQEPVSLSQWNGRRATTFWFHKNPLSHVWHIFRTSFQSFFTHWHHFHSRETGHLKSNHCAPHSRSFHRSAFATISMSSVLAHSSESVYFQGTPISFGNSIPQTDGPPTLSLTHVYPPPLWLFSYPQHPALPISLGLYTHMVVVWSWVVNDGVKQICMTLQRPQYTSNCKSLHTPIDYDAWIYERARRQSECLLPVGMRSLSGMKSL